MPPNFLICNRKFIGAILQLTQRQADYVEFGGVVNTPLLIYFHFASKITSWPNACTGVARGEQGPDRRRCAGGWHCN